MGGMTKAGLADRLYEEINRIRQLTKHECVDLIELALDEIKKGILEEGKLKIAGFGVFEVKEKRARRGRNPQTGGEIIITPRRVLTFTASAKLKNRVNSGE